MVVTHVDIKLWTKFEWFRLVNSAADTFQGKPKYIAMLQ